MRQQGSTNGSQHQGHLILNPSDVIVFTSPKAGSGAAREQIPRLIALLDAAGITHQVLSCPQTLAEISKGCRETNVSQPVVVAAGGDGTISLVASSTTPDTPLLPMPMGTENLLARYFGQTSDAEDVMKTLRSGKARRLDAGEANGRMFLIMATVGFDAEVVRRLHLRRKGHIRRLSYLGPILQTLGAYRFPELKLAAKVAEHGVDRPPAPAPTRAGWAMVFNLPCYAAGLKICPGAIGDDERLDLITFAGRGILTGLRYLAAIFSGRHRKLSDVTHHQVSRIRIESDRPVAYELDGDYAGELPLEIKTLPQRVLLMVPG